MNCTAAGSIPASSSACASSFASIALLLSASLPPRSTTALPALMVKTPASIVTLGRDS